METRPSRGGAVAAAAVTLAALALYLATACPWVLGGDEGELATLAAEGGVAHPPGYPLITLVLRALAWLPASTPAQAAARATGVTGALAVLAVYAACRSWRASPQASAIAATAYAFGSTAWLLATEAEVFALGAAIAMAIVAAAGPAAPLTGARRLGALALLVGLGLAHHHTVVATAPVALFGARAALREGARGRAALVAALAFAAGLSPYAYTLWASHHPEGRWVWGDPMGVADLVHHVLRADYWHPADPRPRAFTTQHLAALAEQVGEDYQWALVGVAAFGAAWAVARRREAEGAWTVVAALVLAGPCFLLMVTWSGGMGGSLTTPTGVYRLIIERFYLLPEALLAVPLAWGADRLLARLGDRAAWLAALAASAAIAATDVTTGHARIAEHEGYTVEDYLVDTLATAPGGAVIVGTGDHRFFGFLYEQHVRKMRPDVLYVDAALRGAPWYARRVERALGPAPAGAPGVAADPIGRALASGRPVLVADAFDEAALARHPHYAIGTLLRVLPDGEAPPDADTLEAMNVAVFGRFTAGRTRPRDPWGWAGEADEAYARPWVALAAAFDAKGDRARAGLALERAARRAP